MTPERLMRHFDRIADAPGAVARLRRFVLDLAVRGKLVEQDPGGTSAPNLDAGVFSLPNGWILSALSEICVSITDGDHLPPPKTNSGIPLLVIGNVRRGHVDFQGCRHVPEEYYKRLDPSRQPRKGDVLFTLVGSYGIPVLITDDRAFCVQRHIGILRPTRRVAAAFLSRVLESKFVFDQATACATGIAQKTVPLSGLRRINLPLPPLAEQHRIVAKVDELMGLCDRLEAAQAERERRRDLLASASLHRVNEVADAPSSRESARFYLTHLPRLTTRVEHVQHLRETILSLAVRGGLVAQDPTDEPRTAPDHLRAETEEKVTPQFPVPQGWEWLRVADIFDVAGGIQKTPDRAPRENAFPYLGVGNVYRGRLDLTNVKEFELQEGELDRRRLEAGDLLIIEGNGSITEVGRCALWRGEIPNCVHQNHVIRCRPREVRTAPFVLLFLNSPAGMEIMQRLAITSSGLYSLSVGKIRQIMLPLPPLAEQHRIVAKVNELMSICDQLEAQLRAGETESRRYLESVLHHALGAAQADREREASG
jgi:type I restriction enzyme, S subunit